MTAHDGLVAAIAAITFLLMLARPGDLAHGVYAFLGAASMVAIGATPLHRLPHLIADTGDVLAFLAGMLVVTGIVERSEVFPLIAEQFARWSRGSGAMLFGLLYLLAVLVTTCLSLDVTVILLPPIVIAVSRRWGMNPIPALVACVLAANMVSLGLPVSNLTNLLMADHLNLGFSEFAAAMFLPNLVAAILLPTLLWWTFRHQITAAISEGQPTASPPARGWTIWCGLAISATLAGICVCGLTGHPLWWASVPAAIMLAGSSLLTNRVRIPTLISDLSLPIFLFVISMSVLVEAIQETWLSGHGVAIPTQSVLAFVAAVSLNAVGSNLVNNVPMTLLSAQVIEASGSPYRDLLAYGSLVGANIGPALTTYGSLATILWFSSVRRNGVSFTDAQYLRIATRIVPIVLIATAIMVWLVVHQVTGPLPHH